MSWTFLDLPLVWPGTEDSERNEASADNVALGRRVTDGGAQRWRWTFELAPVRWDDPRVAALRLHQARQGLAGVFDFVVPLLLPVPPRVQLHEAAAAGATTLKCRTVAPGSRARVFKGQWLQVAGQTKVHAAAALVDISSNVTATLEVWPPLHSAAVSGAAVRMGLTGETVTARVQYARDGRSGVRIDAAGQLVRTVSLVEAL